MIVLGLDISRSTTGWAVTDGERWESGALRCPVKRPFGLEQGKINAGYTAAVADWFDREVYTLVGIHRPEHVGIEQPIPGNSSREKTSVDTNAGWAGQAFKKETVGGTAFDVTHFLHGLVVVACRICGRKNIPCTYVASQTWRSSTGVGRPPQKDPASGAALSYSQRRSWYKKEAQRICALRKIEVSGSDQAEACLLALHVHSALNPRLARHTEDLFVREKVPA